MVIYCFPTEEERRGVISNLESSPEHVFVTGMGCLTTVYHIQKLIDQYPKAVIVHLGIAGAYNRMLNPGECVEVSTETMVDFGAEYNDGRHVSFHEVVPSVHADSFPWKGSSLSNPHPTLRKNLQSVESLTVPFSSGQGLTIARRESHGKAIENMEGAGLFYTCLMNEVRFHSIRSISNYVEERGMSKWNVEKAFRSLARIIREGNND